MDEDLYYAIVMNGATVVIVMLSNHLHLLTHLILYLIVAFDLDIDATAVVVAAALEVAAVAAAAAVAVEMKRVTVVDSSNLKTNVDDVHFADERLTVLHLVYSQSCLC